MSRTVDELEKYAMELSSVDRSRLIDRLEDSLIGNSHKIQQAWAQEAEYRLKEILGAV